MNVTDKEIADLYLIDKLSVQQIADKFDISAYKVRKSLAREHTPIRTRSDANRNLYITKYGYLPFTLNKELTPELEQLKVAGVMLYWGEGAKSGTTVALSNSNPALIKVFLRFLRIMCGVDSSRIHISIHYYPDHNIEDLTEFWSKTTEIPKSQFYKPFLHKAGTGTYRSFSKYGTISVQYSDKLLLNQILEWMNEYETLGESTSSS